MPIINIKARLRGIIIQTGTVLICICMGVTPAMLWAAPSGKDAGIDVAQPRVLAQGSPATAQHNQSPDKEQISALMQQGRRMLEAGERGSALQLFGQVLAIDEKNAEAHYWVGFIYVRENDIEKGIEYMSKSISLNPNNISVRFSLARIFEAMGQYEKAIEQYRSIVTITTDARPKQAAQHRLDLVQGGLLIQQGRTAEAVELLERVLQRRADDVEVLTTITTAYLMLEQMDKAATVLERLVNLAPDNVRARMDLARVLERQEQWPRMLEQLQALKPLPLSEQDRAAVIEMALALAARFKEQDELESSKQALEVVTRLDETHAGALANLGLIYQALKQPERAELLITEAIGLDPNNPLMHSSLGRLYMEMGELELANAEFDKAMQLGGDEVPKNQAQLLLADTYLRRGDDLLKRNVTREALQAYEQALLHNPDLVSAHFNVGLIYYGLNQFLAASAAFEEVSARQPDNARAHFLLASSYDQVGRLDEAAEAYGKAIALSTELATTESMADKLVIISARMWLRKGEIYRAERIMRSALEQNPDDENAHFHLAGLYAGIGWLPEAIEEYLEVLRLNPKNYVARFQIGRLYEQTWDEDQALIHYGTILQLGLTGTLPERAEQRRTAVSKRVNGISYNISQALNFDNNIGLSGVDPISDMLANFSLRFMYNRKLRDKIRFGLSLGPSYSAFIRGGFDLFVTTMSPSLTLGQRDRHLELGYRWSDQSSFIDDRTIAETADLWGEARFRWDKPVTLEPGPAPHSLGPKKRLLTTRLSYRDYVSKSNQFLSSETMVALINFNLSPPGARSYTVGTGYTINDNKLRAGSDYAYRSNSLTAQIGQQLAAKINANASYTFTDIRYANPDSLTGFTQHRHNQSHAISAGLSYQLNNNVRFFGGYSFLTNRSNLPVGFSLTGSDIIEGQEQSASLGSFNNQKLTFGVSINH